MNELPPLSVDFNIQEEWQGLAQNALSVDRLSDSPRIGILGPREKYDLTLRQYIGNQKRSGLIFDSDVISKWVTFTC